MTTRLRALLGLLALLVVTISLAAACGDDDDGDGDGDGEGLVGVKAALGWLANGTFAPTFLALENGYFEEEGLDVDLRQGGPGTGVELLQGGQLDFIVGTQDDIPLGYPQGFELKSVAVLVHQSPSAIIVRGDSDIQEPADLEGRTIGANPFGEARLLLETYLEAAGVDVDSVEIATLDSDILGTSLLTGQVDAIADFMTEGLTQIKLEDPDARAFPYSEAGVNVISTGIMTTKQMTEENPDVVRGFVRAVLRGYAAAAGNPEAAVDAGAKYYPDAYSVKEVSRGELEVFLTLMETPETEANGIGYSTDEEWQRLADTLAELAELEEVQPVEEYYTTEFLPEEPIQLES